MGCASTPQPGDRFRFRFVRAGGRAGDRSVDVRSDFRRKDGSPFPFSLFDFFVCLCDFSALSLFPFCLEGLSLFPFPISRALVDSL